MTDDEFNAWWMRIMQDRTVAQNSIARCYDDNSDDNNNDDNNNDNDNTDPQPSQCSSDLESFKWGEQVVTPIKNQGQCGSCYSFSAMTVLESAKAIQTGKPVVSYSEQQIVDCQSNYSNC